MTPDSSALTERPSSSQSPGHGRRSPPAHGPKQAPSALPLLTCTRAMEFDAAHRLVGHASKCAHLHGHRYRLEVTCIGNPDKIGVIIDFAEVKGRVGRWVEDHLDHAALFRKDDKAVIELCKQQNWRVYLLDDNPTAENLARYLLGRVQHLLKDLAPQITVQKVRLYETPNCWADATLGAV